MIRQLTLDLGLSYEITLDNYYTVSSNRQLLMTLNAMARGRGEHMVYLHGISGVGKTHLLKSCCHVSGNLGLTTQYLSFKELDKLNADVFDGLEALSLVCLDDLHLIVEQCDMEESVFHFFNRVRDEKRRLIIAAKNVPNNLHLRLLDLVSRLNSMVVFYVNNLSDDDKMRALTQRAKINGITLPLETAKFIVTHCPRDMGSLFGILEKLDQCSLEEQHRLTIPFVKRVIGLLR